jgi:broad specificity phosphatase PhoE
MSVLLVRHASAGNRKSWTGDDRLRPLDERGRREAEGLVDALAGYHITRVVTSPYVRCHQTVEPLAAARGLQVEERDELAEGASRQEALALLAEPGTGAFCTHGDVVEMLLGEESPKGSTWILHVDAGEVVPLEYVGPAA